MKTMAYVKASAVIFSLVALVHLLRLLQGWPVQLGTIMVPFWISVLTVIISGGVAIWGFLLLRRT